MKQLNQAVAIRKGVQNRVHEVTTELHKSLGQASLFNGFSKQFRSLDEAGERFPDESNKVQLTADSTIKQITKSLTELFDTEATVDKTNGVAQSDIVIDGEVIVAGVPATTLLFLEKQLGLLRSDLKKVPELDPAETWTKDENSGLNVTEVQQTHKTKKIQKAIVLVEPTKEHPAQAQLITEDVTVGHWFLTKMSGAMPKPQKDALLEKADKLIDAVKAAREKANTQEVVEMEVGTKLFNFLLK